MIPMAITFKNYKLLGDFETVNDFLRQNYTKYEQNGNPPQPYFEYAHTHPCFDHKMTHRFGVWEDDGQIAAVACYKMYLVEVFLMTKIGYEQMKPIMLEYAEKELSKINDDVKRNLDVYIYDYETKMKELLEQRGYKMEYAEDITVFKYSNGFKEYTLPERFSVISLED